MESEEGQDYSEENREEINESQGQDELEQSQEEPTNNLIADIFGESDDEGEFEGFAEARKNVSSDEDEDKDEKEGDDEKEDEERAERSGGERSDEESGDDIPKDSQGNQDEQLDTIVPDVSSDSDDDDGSRRKVHDDIVYDFDLMLERKRQENSRKRRKRNVDIINDNDDIIAEMIRDMKQAAEEDFENNKNRMAATRKLKMLQVVVNQLRKLDLREAFLDAGVLSVITDWLTPLPDRSLPHLQIRENMLKILGEFNIDDTERIKASGIGKAVMYLFKHPKETKENKKLAGLLVSAWSRPIFNVDTDFHSMTKEEREARDFEHMKKTKRMRGESTSEYESTPKISKNEEKNLRPGDKGWVPRARVPMPSMKDYVVRPKSNIEMDIHRSGSSKKVVSRLDKHLRKFQEKKILTKTQRAVPISIEGRKMAL